MKLVVLTLAVLSVVFAAALAYSGASSWGGRPEPGFGGRIPIGVLGDSDSVGYQGRPPLGVTRSPAGGVHHAATLQWTEVLARIRVSQVDLGEWAYWGVPRLLSMARVRDGIGMRWRAPRKEDHRHNLAWASGCGELHKGPLRQAQRLVEIMDEDPAAWRRGVVIIRSGVNNFGKESLDLLAVDPADMSVRKLIDDCLDDVRKTVALIRERHPFTGIVLVGIFNNADWPPYFGKFQTTLAMANVNQGLDRFDNGLRVIARDQARVMFFDDRAWFAGHWGGRDATGKPAYRTVQIGDGLKVTNSVGDGPNNTILANGHNGLVWNALWVQQLVAQLRRELQIPLDEVADREVRAFVQSSIDASAGGRAP